MNDIDIRRDHTAEFDQVLSAVSTGHMLVAADPALQQKIFSAGLADGPQDHEGETGPVLQTAPERVGAVIGAGGEELMKQPAMAQVEDHAIKAGPLHLSGGIGKFRADLCDVSLVHRPDNDTVRAGVRGGAQNIQSAVRLFAFGAAVEELDHRQCAVGLPDGIGKLTEHLLLLRTVKVPVFVDRAGSAGTDSGLANDKFRSSAGGFITDGGQHLFGQRAVFAFYASHRGADHSVSPCFPANGQGLKQVRVFLQE